MKSLTTLTILIVFLILMSGCGTPESANPTSISPTQKAVPQQGRVTIATTISFSVLPPTGTFAVVEGADILGCSAGSFVDTPVDPRIQKLMTCESGTRTGTFTLEFTPEAAPRPGDMNGPWNIVAATGDFIGLTGEGDFWVVDNEESGVGYETLTGRIEYRP